MTPLDAMKQALAALEEANPSLSPNGRADRLVNESITNLRTAIAEMENVEPVFEIGFGWLNAGLNPDGTPMPKGTKLYTHPAQSRNEPNFIDLLKGANAIVKSKSIYKRFMESTPLENDVPVWMADFAMEHGIYQPVEPAQSRDSIIEENKK